MIGKDFMFCDKHLLDFGFIMAKPSEEDTSGLNREILKGSTTAYRSQAIHYGTVYSDVITLPLFIVKFNCDYDDSKISMFELRKIQAWLTSSKLPQSLFIVTEEGTMVEYRGIFTEISPYYYDGLNGINLKFTCDSPFVYDTKTIKIQADEAKDGITKRMFCDTDENEEYIYPLIQFYPNSTGEISFKNNNDDGKVMSLSLSKKYNEVTIDCKLKRIIADGIPLSLSDVGWNIKQINDFNNVDTGIYKMYWLRLLPERNYVDIIGNGNFIITYKNLLKLGGLTDV
ncbi:MAG: hypothetical protein K2N51_18585 [Lachnospiraceae bacterium]|nr:hypothetical protein [Lachnospiraceae bacterium]